MMAPRNVGGGREIRQRSRLQKPDTRIWLVTFALPVFAALTVAVEAGMILAALLFISRVAATTTVSQVTDEYVEDGPMHILQDKDILYYATLFPIHVPFPLASTDKSTPPTTTFNPLLSSATLPFPPLP